MSVITKTGDKGTTALKGRRVAKNDVYVEAIGNIDELNAWIGKLAPPLVELADKQIMLAIQLFLFDLGSIVSGYTTKDVPVDLLNKLETSTTSREAKMAKQKYFIIPTEQLDIQITRSIVRRTERSLVGLIDEYPNAFRIVNRLSDWLFVLARHLTKNPVYTNLDNDGFHQVLK